MSYDTSVDCQPMAAAITLPKPRPIKGPAPRLDTVHRVEMVLRRAYERDDGPLSLAELKRRLGVKSVRHSTIRACIDELVRLGLVTHDPKHGVMWTLCEDPKLWDLKGTKRLA